MPTEEYVVKNNIGQIVKCCKYLHTARKLLQKYPGGCIEIRQLAENGVAWSIINTIYG